MLTKEQIERVITDAMQSDDAVSLNVSPAHIAAEKIAELTKADTQLLTSAAALENEVTSTLLDMAVATVLATLLEEEGGGRSNVSISPNSMNYMTKNYTYDVTMNGLVRNISIQMRPDSPLYRNEDAWNEPSNRHGVALDPDMSGAGAKPQAEPKVHDRPVWAVSWIDEEGRACLAEMRDAADAAQRLGSYKVSGSPWPQVQNRYCLHPECPSSVCNRAEATSEPVEG